MHMKNIHNCGEIEARVDFSPPRRPSSSDDPLGVSVVLFRVHDGQGRRVVERLLHWLLLVVVYTLVVWSLSSDVLAEPLVGLILD